jgi:hypothetical protein
MSALYTGINDQLILDKIDPDWFWSQVTVTEPGLCWPWLAGHTKDGYGTLRLSGTSRVVRANRVALLLKTGHPLGELHALHHCDNPPCCNPLCLWAGTNTDNMRDCVAKGRWGLRPVRFTRSQQVGIRRSYAHGKTTIRDLATRYKTGTRTIQDILHKTGGYGR